VHTLLRRAIECLVLSWLVVTLTFVLARLAPGDPVDLLVAPTASPEDAARLRDTFGLNRSLPEQYARWLSGVLQGDLGASFASGEPVRTVIARALPISIALGLASLALTFGVGSVVGLWQAARRGRWSDRLTTIVSVTIFSAPSYWLALALVALFTYGASRWGWPAVLRLPAFGVESPGGAFQGWARVLDVLRHAVLPVAVLALIGAAGIARYARAAALDLLGTGFVRTARAKGVGARRVMTRHVGANARPQLIVLFALSLPGVIAGSVFVESIFAWPGMGRTMLGAIAARDYPVIVGVTVVYATAVILANALADLAVERADPRRRA
jgi:peptide/nickel transport system permease protein